MRKHLCINRILVQALLTRVLTDNGVRCADKKNINIEGLLSKSSHCAHNPCASLCAHFWQGFGLRPHNVPPLCTTLSQSLSNRYSSTNSSNHVCSRGEASLCVRIHVQVLEVQFAYLANNLWPLAITFGKLFKLILLTKIIYNFPGQPELAKYFSQNEKSKNFLQSILYPAVFIQPDKLAY